jgi:hypothetical protein
MSYPNPTRHNASAVVVLCLLANFATAALADDKQTGHKQTAQAFLGPIEGGPELAQVAVVIDGKNVLAYICSPDDEFNNPRAHSTRLD